MERRGYFQEDELVILGSGGGRFMAVTQHRSTGGFILRALLHTKHPIQIHIDPGPGAIRDIRDYHINPRQTTHLILTHNHTDHSMSLPIIIEALHTDLSYKFKQGIFIAPVSYIVDKKPDPFYLSLLKQVIPMSAGQTEIIDPGFKITATPAYHQDSLGLGYILEFGNSVNYHYRIAFTSDTQYFREYTSLYQNIDVLVANILRPDSQTCPGHLCVDEFIPLLQMISPKICILTHFGASMDSPDRGNKVPAQVQKIQAILGANIHVIGSFDGQIIKFRDG